MASEDDLKLNNPESGSEGDDIGRKKIRVKKRVRIKKKKDPKRKLKKALLAVMWTLIIIAIIVTFIIMMGQLNINDKDTRKKKTEILTKNRMELAFVSVEDKGCRETILFGDC